MSFRSRGRARKAGNPRRLAPQNGDDARDAAGRVIASRLADLWTAARARTNSRRLVPSVRDPGGRGLARDPITQDRIPAARAVRLHGAWYDSHSLANLLNAADRRDPVFGRRSPRVPHAPGATIEPSDRRAIRDLARRTGWRSADALRLAPTMRAVRRGLDQLERLYPTADALERAFRRAAHAMGPSARLRVSRESSWETSARIDLPYGKRGRNGDPDATVVLRVDYVHLERGRYTGSRYMDVWPKITALECYTVLGGDANDRWHTTVVDTKGGTRAERGGARVAAFEAALADAGFRPRLATDP